MGEHDCFHQGRVADAHAVMHLEAFLQATQNGDGVLHTGLFHKDGLEPALKGGILFDVLAVFVQGCGTYAVQLAPGQHWLQKVACVHGAFGLACTHDGVEFVDKEDDCPLALLHFLQDCLEPFLEFAAVLCTGNEGAHVQGVELVPLEVLGHVALDDTVGQTFHDGCLANTCLADKHGVVLGPAREDAYDAADFLVPAYDRIKLAVAHVLQKVACVLRKGLDGLFRVGAGDSCTSAQLLHGLGKGSTGQTVLAQNLAQRLACRLVRDGAEEMIHAHVLVVHAGSFLLGCGNDLEKVLAHHELAWLNANAGNRRTLAHHFLDGHIESFQLHAHALQYGRNYALVLTNQGQGKMCCIRFLMTKAVGYALGIAKSLSGLVGKFFYVHVLLPDPEDRLRLNQALSCIISFAV